MRLRLRPVGHGFLELLLADIGPVRECGWTFTSDQQKVCVSFLCKLDVVFIVYIYI